MQLWIWSNDRLAHFQNKEKLIDKLNSSCLEQGRYSLAVEMILSVDMKNSIILASKIIAFCYKILLSES